jgi:hypothetical protein
MKSETAKQRRLERFRNPVPTEVWISIEQVSDEIGIRRNILRRYADVMSPEYRQTMHSVIAAFQTARAALKRLDSEASRETRRSAP